MSDKRSLRFLLVLLFAACSSAALVLAGAGASGQNTNSSTTEEGMQETNANANTNAPRRGRGRRGRQRPAASAADTAQPTAELSVAAPTAQEDDDSRGDLSGEQVDLSGTYEGRVTMTGGHEMSGAATLTITGNSFTLTGEGMTHTGRIYSVLTRGATSAALYFTDIQDTTTSTPLAANVRARKRGDTLMLTPAPNAKNRLTFTQARGRR